MREISARGAGRRRGVSARSSTRRSRSSRRAVHPARRLPQARLGAGVRVPRRRGAVGRGRLHRDERRRPVERAHRGGRARRAEAGARRRLQGGLGHRAARRRPRPVRCHRLLLVPDRRAAQLADLGDQRPRRPRVRRLAHLGVRASRRRHLHEGRRRRRRPRRQDRGRHPRGRPAERGRDRGQRRRQRRRLRRHGGRPVRDVRRHRGRSDAARDARRARRRPLEPDVPLSARARLGGRGRVGDRHVLRAARPRRERGHQRALQGGARRDRALGDRVHPDHDGVRRRQVRLRRPLHLVDHRPRRHVPARRDHRVLHRHPLEPGEGDREGVADRPRDEHHRRARDRHAGDRCSGDRDRRGHPRRAPLRRPLRHRRRGDGAALDDRADRRARRLRPRHRQRGRHRRDGRPAGRGARRHRSARRGREHDEGRHEGLRDRLGRARRADPVRLVHDRPLRRRPHDDVLARPTRGSSPASSSAA